MTLLNIYLDRNVPIWLLWTLWKSRNLLIFQNKVSTWQSDLSKAVLETQDWISVWPERVSCSIARGIQQQTSEWSRPRNGFIKCNYDCSFTSHNGNATSGWITRDFKGFIHTAGYSSGNVCSSVLEAELQSLLIAMQQTWIKGYKHVIFEGDNKLVHNLLEGKTMHFGMHNWIREIKYWSKRFEEVEFKWTKRHNNKAADRLAKEPTDTIPFMTYFYIPAFIVNILHEDNLTSS
ncbi:uncharacterized protein LOC111832413 [Capsella rubella]|uniref:uncharacterized protein LOC111832413 n=1 Tax=Capsella rubella TaxID=81985 RepID=UPI000CD5B6CA|nr:uncharacterized protein LOC111832413 [Capsella rubella]